jgi:LysM repeat protein
VGEGESLWTISRLYGVSEAELRAANGIRGSRILVGQELVVPGVSVVSAATVIQHRVRQGDSLWTIAQQHGASVEEIRRQNGIGSSRIYAGQVIEVPIGR